MVTTSWGQARRIAESLDPSPTRRISLFSALGSVLAEPVAAVTDLPPVPSAAEAGWAVRGIGPWRVVTDLSDGELPDGCAYRLPGGAALPSGAQSVLTDAFAVVENSPHLVLVGQDNQPAIRPGVLRPGFGVAPPGAAATAGQTLLKPGELLTVGSLALAAAAGVDDVVAYLPPNIVSIQFSVGLLDTGPPRRGRDRNIVGPLVSSWIMGAGARRLPEMTIPEDPEQLAATIDNSGGDLVVVTGGRNPGISVAVEPALAILHAKTILDGVDIEPGGTVLLAELRDGRRVLALPREPASAIVSMCLLLQPSVAALAAQTKPRWPTVMLREPVPASSVPRALPVTVIAGELADLATAQQWSGPHGLAPLAEADGIGFIGAEGANRGESVPFVALPGRL